MEHSIILQNFLPKNSHPNKSMIIYPNYFLLIYFLSFLVSIAFGQKKNDEDPSIIERRNNTSVDFNNGTADSMNETALNGTGSNENGTVNLVNGTALNGIGFNVNRTVNSVNGAALNATGINENGTVNSMNGTTLNVTGINGNGTVNSVNGTALNGTGFNENGTVISINGTTTTVFNLNETEWNETLKALNDSFQQTFQPIMMTTTKMPRQIPVGPKLYNDSQVDSKWKIRMVHNLRWDLSKNFLAVSYLNLQSQTYYVDGIAAISVIGEHYYPGSRMSFFYGIDQPNMLIRFNQTQNGAAFCEFGQLKESVIRKTQKQLNVWEWKNCVYQRNPIYYDEVNLTMKTQLYAFCPIPSADDGTSVFNWRLANGTYNPPSRTPHCIYDFHRKATEPEEYHLLKYCSKAYFFNGMDYNMPNKRMRNRRKDWLLYLAEGQLKCSISGDTQTDMDLVGKGYTVELVQYSLPRRLGIYLRKCPKLEATLMAYKDQMKQGKFIIAAVIGSAQLDGDLGKPYEEKSYKFWDKNTYNEKFKYMNFEDKSCYIFYQTFLHDLRTRRYHLELKISHYCTERGMRGILEFFIPIGPDQVPEEGIYEDIGIQIDLGKGQMRRSTGQIINAKKNEKPIIQGLNKTQFDEELRLNAYKEFKEFFSDGIEHFSIFGVQKLPNKSPLPNPSNTSVIDYTDGTVSANGKCKYTHECEKDYRCWNPMKQAYCEKILDRDLNDMNMLLTCSPQFREKWDRDHFYVPQGLIDAIKKISGSDTGPVDFSPRCLIGNNSVMRTGAGPDKRGVNCKVDSHCRIDEFCAFQNGECRKFRFQMDGEKCYLNSECFPGAYCKMDSGLNQWGKCQYTKVANQLVEEPNDPLD